MISDFASLTASFKRMASITWSDDDTDAQVKDIMEDAEQKMNHMLGAEIDYSVPGDERQLYIDYCLYRWNGVSEQFESAYRSDILRIRHRYEVKKANESENQNIY